MPGGRYLFGSVRPGPDPVESAHPFVVEPAERLAHPKMGEPGCLEGITTLHPMPGFILPGHEIPDVEQVVKQAATYTIITGQTARTD